MVVPPVHVADNLQLGPRDLRILVKGVEVARGELYAGPAAGHQPGHGDAARSTASPTREPAFGLPALVDRRPSSATRATAAGYTVVDPTTALSTHLSEIIRTFLPDLLSRQQTKEMVDRVAQHVAASWSRSWCRSCSSSATSSACCGSCCASACRSAT